MYPTLVGRFFTTSATWDAPIEASYYIILEERFFFFFNLKMIKKKNEYFLKCEAELYFFLDIVGIVVLVLGFW